MTHDDTAGNNGGCHGRLLGSCNAPQQENAGCTQTDFTNLTHLPLNNQRGLNLV